MVTRNQPSPKEESSWDLREQLGMKTQKEEEIQKSTCFMWQILSSFHVFRIGSVLMLEQLTPKSQKAHTHAYTHSLSTCKRTVVSEAPLAYTCTMWNMQLLGQEREKPELHGVFMPLLRSDTGDNTHVSLARMSHWEIEKQLFDEYYYWCHILGSNAVSFFFFLALVKFLRYNFVQKLNVIRPSPEWDLKKAFCIWFLRLVCLWLLTALLSVLSGSSQIRVSPAPTTLPTQYH